MMISMKENLDKGLYTPERAAFYARVPLRRFNRWCFGDRQGERVFEVAFDSKRMITFHEFIQTLAIRHLLLYHDISLRKIREGIERAQGDYSVTYPLAREHVMFLFQRDLFIKLKGEQYEKLTGKDRKQMMMTPVCDLFAEDVGWDAEGLARTYTAFTWKDRLIKMTPGFHLGEPVVENCHYTAYSLWEAAKAEGGFRNAANAFGIDIEDVHAGYRYIDSLLTANAA